MALSPSLTESRVMSGATCFPHLCLAVKWSWSTPPRLGLFPGGILRGALSFALKDAVCLVGHRECSRCHLLDQCHFPQAFGAPPQMGDQRFSSPPFRIQWDEGWRTGASWEMRLWLFGQAIHHRPFWERTLERMAERGVGINRARLELESVREVPFRPLPSSLTALDLAVRTPMRLVMRHEARKTLQRTFHWEPFRRSLLRRVGGMSRLWAPEWVEPTVPVSPPRWDAHMNFQEWSRHSSHQGQDIEMGGLQGYLRLTGDLQAWLPWLDAARILAVGKNTAFGLGHIESLSSLSESRHD